MAEITAKLVSELREKTSAGMMDCKKALVECGGDFEAAVDFLRKKGIAKAESKAGREAKEGTVQVLTDGKIGVVVEINCETDFVGKNEKFRAFVDTIAEHIHKTAVADGTLDAMLAQNFATGGTVADAVKAKVSEIGENIVVRRFRRLQADENSVLTKYIHAGGRVGVLLEVSTGKAETRSNEDFLNFVKDITLQIAASSPLHVQRSEVSESLIAKEREIAAAQMEGKPAQVIDKIVTGKIDKFLSGICLLEQGFIKEPEQTIAQLTDTVGKKAGDTITIKQFVRFALGEQIAS
jgi:elongation factor Ts